MTLILVLVMDSKTSTMLLFYTLMIFQDVYSRPVQLTRDRSVPESIYDSTASSLTAKSLKTPSSGLVTAIPFQSNDAVSALTLMTLSYVTYVAANLYFPTTLTTIGIPVLKDFSRERNLRPQHSISQSFLNSLATDFVTDVLSKTEAAGTLRNTSATVIDNSVKSIKRTSRFAGDHLSSFHGLLDNLTKALSPGCLSRYMCKTGQFTSLHLPGIAAMLRSVEFESLDDYGQAFIDGTTIGDCNSVFPHCDAWSDE